MFEKKSLITIAISISLVIILSLSTNEIFSLKFDLFITSFLRDLYTDGALLALKDILYKEQTYLKCFCKFLESY